jgi:uncharacterized delta-60 repeat protein
MKTFTRFRRARLSLERLEDRDVPTTGGLDLSFSGDGKTLLDLAVDQTKFEGANAVAVQADGKIVVVGSREASQPNDTDFAIARFNRDGTVDTSFSSPYGYRIIQFNYDRPDFATCVAIQEDGKIVVGGAASDGFSGNKNFAVCRLDPDGSTDNSFGYQGKQTIDIEGEDYNGIDICRALVLTADGKIVLVGETLQNDDQDLAIVRLDANGELDDDFSNDGKRTVAFNLGGWNYEYGNSVALSNGKIIIGGWARSDNGGVFIACRLTQTGNLDTTFGTFGKVNFTFPNVDTDGAHCQAMALQKDGKIILAGSAYKTASGIDFAIARLNVNGTLDTTFSGDGLTTVGFNIGGADWDIGNAVGIQSDGKIVVAGNVQRDDGNQDFGVVRLNSNGTLDTTFAGDGKKVVSFDQNDAPSLDMCEGMAICPDGIVLVGRTFRSTGLGSPVRSIAVARLIRDQWVVVSADQGGPPTVKIFTPTGTLLFQFDAYGAVFTGGVRVSTADINGDSVPEIFCAPGPGGAPYVNVFDGRTFSLLRQIQVYGSTFTLGVNLTVGNVLGDGNVELLVAPDVGGAPYVNIFNPLDGTFLKQIQVYGLTFTKGVRLTTGNVSGDSKHEILVAPQAGGSPIVNILDASTSMLVKQITAYELSYTGGLYLACDNVNSTGKVDLIVGRGQGGTSTVKIYETSDSTLLHQRQVFGQYYVMGIRVGVIDVDGDGTSEVIAGVGKIFWPGLEIFDWVTGTISKFQTFNLGLSSGVFVCGGVR